MSHVSLIDNRVRKYINKKQKSVKMAEKELLPGEVRQLSSGCILEEFKEAKEVHKIIGNVGNIFDQQIPVEMAIERFQG